MAASAEIPLRFRFERGGLVRVAYGADLHSAAERQARRLQPDGQPASGGGSVLAAAQCAGALDQ